MNASDPFFIANKRPAATGSPINVRGCKLLLRQTTKHVKELAQQNARLNAVYGDCFEPIVYPYLELEEETE